MRVRVLGVQRVKTVRKPNTFDPSPSPSPSPPQFEILALLDPLSPGIFNDPTWGGSVLIFQFFLELHLYYTFFLTKSKLCGQNDLYNNHFHPDIFLLHVGA